MRPNAHSGPVVFLVACLVGGLACTPSDTCRADADCAVEKGEICLISTGRCGFPGDAPKGENGKPGDVPGDGGMVSGDGGDDPNTDGGQEASDSGQAEADSGPSVDPNAPVLLYTFEEAGGDRVLDRSGHEPPLDLFIEDTQVVFWGNGTLTTSAPGTIMETQGSANRVIEACQASNALTLEAWVTPIEQPLTGPDRIMTCSSGGDERNFSLLYENDDNQSNEYTVRLRRDDNISGMPALSAGPGSLVPTIRQHVVYVHDPEAQMSSIYIDGALRGSRLRSDDALPDFRNWSYYVFALADEVNDTGENRRFIGTYHKVAVYCRALDAEEVGNLTLAGP
jgi:hypothetical protein